MNIIRYHQDNNRVLEVFDKDLMMTVRFAQLKQRNSCPVAGFPNSPPLYFFYLLFLLPAALSFPFKPVSLLQ